MSKKRKIFNIIAAVLKYVILIIRSVVYAYAVPVDDNFLTQNTC